MSHTRIGSFNVENMFERPKVMGRNATRHAAPILAAHARFNELIACETYTPEVKDELRENLATLELLRSDRSKYAILRRIQSWQAVASPGSAGWSSPPNPSASSPRGTPPR